MMSVPYDHFGLLDPDAEHFSLILTQSSLVSLSSCYEDVAVAVSLYDLVNCPFELI
jgi:hypothetical protein